MRIVTVPTVVTRIVVRVRINGWVMRDAHRIDIAAGFSGDLTNLGNVAAALENGDADSAVLEHPSRAPMKCLLGKADGRGE